MRSAINNAPDGQVREIQLTENVECPDPGDFYKAGPISVGQGKIIVLDLNGYTVDRGLYKGPDAPENLNPHSRGSVIQLYGDSTLTVRDSQADPKTGIGQGRITGGYGSYTPGGVMVMCEATFILESGVIEGNCASRQYGGGVHVMRQYVETLKPGTFIMKGGAIRNNVAENDNGGGVNVGGTFEMLGGEITGNRTEKRGGGVWVEDCGIMILGAEKPRNSEITVKITGNTRRADGENSAENVFLSEGSPLGVLSRLSTGPEDADRCVIGVTSGKEPTAREPALITNVVLKDDVKDELSCFVSDDPDYKIGRNGTGLVILGVPVKLSFSPGAGSGDMEPQHELGGISFFLPDSEGFHAPTGQGFDCWLINGRRYEAYEEITLTADATATALYGNLAEITMADGKAGTYDRSVRALVGKTYPLPFPEEYFEYLLKDNAFRGWKIGEEAEIRDPGYLFTVTGNTRITAQWGNEPMTWTALRTKLSEAKNGETIRLYNDVIRQSDDINLPLVPRRISHTGGYPVQTTLGTVTLDLNGHTLSRSLAWGEYGFVIETSNIHLIITDTSPRGNGKITGGQYYRTEFQTGQGGGILIGDESTVTLKGGSISGNHALYGGGVTVKGANAKFNMEGGSITGNSAEHDGGGVYLYQGVMTITDGEITGNTAKGSAGAIMASAETKLRIFGGSIYGNKSHNCGSVWIDGEAYLYVQGAPEMICETDEDWADENLCDVYLASRPNGKRARIDVTDVLYNNNPIDVILGGGTGVFTSRLNNYATAKNFAAAEAGYMTAPTLDDKVVIGDLIDVSFDPNGTAGTRDPEKAVRGGIYVLLDLDRYAYSDPFSGKPYGILWPDGLSFNGWLLPGEDEPRAAGSTVSFSEPATLTVSWADKWGMVQSQIDAGESIITLDGNLLSARNQYGYNFSAPLTIPAGADVVLDLNGFEIDRRCEGYEITENGCAILVKGRLTIRDSSGDLSGRITGGNGKRGGAIRVEEGGELILQGGGITGNAAQYGGGVYVGGGRFTMTGGFISENKCLSENTDEGRSGGGVYVSGNGTFTMTGGTIAGNSSTESGGGVCMIDSASVTIGGDALITNNSARYGGGVFAAGGTQFAMEGGEIGYNEIDTWGYGGGVYLQEGSAGAMSGGIIRGNRGSYGGGVRADGSFTMSGGSITENTADALGGGVYVRDKFVVSGNAQVTDNTLNGSDCNVYLTEDKTIVIGYAFAGVLGVTPRNTPTAEAPVTLTAGYGATKSTGSVLTDTDNWFIDLSESGEILLGVPVMLSFDPGPGSGSMDFQYVIGGLPFELPESTFIGPNGGQDFDKWIIGEKSYTAGATVTLTSDSTAIAVYKDYYTPGLPVDNWQRLANALAAGGYVTLVKDISGAEADEDWPDLIVAKSTTLDLAGHVLICKPDKPIAVGDAEGISTEPVLTILDSDPGAVHDGFPQQGGIIVGGIELANSSTLTLTGGTLFADRKTAVRVGPFAKFAMQGGWIKPMDGAETDTGVSVEPGGSFTLSAGYVRSFAAGVRNTNGTVTLSGGYIQENTIGVENVKMGRLTLSGSVIGGTNTQTGQIGVINSGGSSFIMSGGTIQNVLDSVYSDGTKVSESGMEPLSGAEFTMTGGTIHDAGGILVQGENAVFTLKDGTITGIRKGGLVPAAVLVADGGTFAMAGGEILDSSLAAVAVGTDKDPSAAESVFSLDSGTISNVYGSLAEGEPSASVVIGSLGTFSMSGGEILFRTGGNPPAPDRIISVLDGAIFRMTDGRIIDAPGTGVAVESGRFEMSGGTVGGKTIGVTVSGTENAYGEFILSGGIVSGCGETGVAVSEKSEFVLIDGGIRNNPAAVGVDVLGGNVAVMGGSITGNRLGARAAGGSFILAQGMVAANAESDICVLAAPKDKAPWFGLATSVGLGNVRLEEKAVIHVDGPLEQDGRIVVDAVSGLGSAITDGLKGNGEAAQFVSKNDALSVIADENGEAVFAYGVFFDTGKGTAIEPQYLLAEGKTVREPAPPTRENATFDGWYLDDSKYDFWTVVTKSMTLKAKWTYRTMRETDFALPAALAEIRAYAFNRIERKAIVFSAPGTEGEQAQRVIRRNAFAGCRYLEVLIPDGWRIEPGAFDGCEAIVLFGPEDGTANRYADLYPDDCSFCPLNETP